MVLDTSDVQALLGKEYEVAFVRLVLRRYQRWWMKLKTNYLGECSDIHRCLNDRRCSTICQFLAVLVMHGEQRKQVNNTLFCVTKVLKY